MPATLFRPSRVPSTSATRSISESISVLKRLKIATRLCLVSALPIARSDFPPPAAPPNPTTSAIDS